MKKRWNISLWAGFAIALVAGASYIPVFANYPETRDVPWVNYLLFAIAGVLLAVGLKRAYAQPDRYRGKISGPILSGLSLLLAGLFVVFVFYFSKQLPASANALKIGQPAPSFTLASADGRQVSLADLLKGRRGAVLIFYRGYW